MKRIILLFSLVLSFAVLFAQQKSITGRVTDENNEPVPGANVVVKGTTTGTVTDIDGHYKIQVSATSKVLTVTFIGFDPQDVNITGKTSVNVKLKLSSIGLEEVVAVGYGTQKKVNLTGSIESVKGDALAKRSTVQTSQALEGIAAGVTVTSNNGKPGKENTTIRIRGVGTINDNSPLVLVDGVASSVDAVDPNDRNWRRAIC